MVTATVFQVIYPVVKVAVPGGIGYDGPRNGGVVTGLVAEAVKV
jgi:hypothetical protein